MRKYASFAEFYPFYLSEHSGRTTRRIHFLGSGLGLVCLFLMVITGDPIWLLIGLVIGYGLACVLMFVGLKMVWLNGVFDGHFPIAWSLGIITTLIGGSVVASLAFPRRPAAAEPEARRKAG